MLIQPADNIIANLERDDRLGLVIADIPTSSVIIEIVVAWNEALIHQR